MHELWRLCPAVSLARSTLSTTNIVHPTIARSWGTDLSFSFVYIRDLDPTGAAALSGVVRKGDQLCELRAVTSSAPTINLVGAPFDAVMNAFAQLDRTVSEVDLVFFRGTKDELKDLATGGDGDGTPETITVTVLQQGANNTTNTTTLTAPAGVNLRQLLVDNQINVYQSLTRWTNCRGQQLCGTCIVDVIDGEQQYTNRKSMDEASTLRENPGAYRLSCVTFAYGNVTVRTLPPIGAAQWTR